MEARIRAHQDPKKAEAAPQTEVEIDIETARAELTNLKILFGYNVLALERSELPPLERRKILDENPRLSERIQHLKDLIKEFESKPEEAARTHYSWMK